MTEADDGTKSLPEYAKNEELKSKLPWFSNNIDKYLTPDARELLSEYSYIPESEHSKHYHEIREQAWAITSYPCTGLGLFMVNWVTRSAAYQEILERLKAGQTFVDIGCHLGSDLRALACAGAPTSNMYGIDIISHWDVGFNLYNDRGRFESHFIEADMLSDNPQITALLGKADIISISAVMHQWDWDTQVKAIKRVIEFSRLGSIVIGYQVGSLKGKQVFVPKANATTFQHNEETFKKQWAEVAEATDTKWDVQVDVKDDRGMGWDPNDMLWLDADHRIVTFLARRMK